MLNLQWTQMLEGRSCAVYCPMIVGHHLFDRMLQLMFRQNITRGRTVMLYLLEEALMV